MASETPSTKPYLIRALHQWCTDFGFTPFLAVFVDERVEVPMEFVKNNEIVLNISSEACHQLHIENDWISLVGSLKRYWYRYLMCLLSTLGRMAKACLSHLTQRIKDLGIKKLVTNLKSQRVSDPH
jgi:hypothetical protein